MPPRSPRQKRPSAPEPAAQSRPTLRPKQRTAPRRWFRNWLALHHQEARSSLARLRGRPLPTLMTVLMIGIALALPGTLYVLTRNLSLLGAGWEHTAAISVFLKTEVNAEQAQVLARRLAGREDLENVILIPPEQALQELRAETGFAEAVEQLETNPLPYVLSLRPKSDLEGADILEGLRESLSALPETDLVRMDTLWVRRFQGIIKVGERAGLVLASALAMGVLLVIGNTIRLEIENCRQEIVIMETVGATRGFIRRPFLWLGLWVGGLGGLMAWFLIALARWLMQAPVSQLAALYQADFVLVGLGPSAQVVLLGGSLVLGLLGSWISVARHLAEIEPA